MKEQRKAFDTAAYLSSTGFSDDLASLSIESATDLPLEKRINPFVLQLTPDGKVINPLLGNRDISEYYSGETLLDLKERQAGLAIRDCLLNRPDGTFSVWISPPGGPANYQEGRIVVGENKSENGVKIIDSYAICHRFPPLDCLSFSRRLSEFSRDSLALNTVENLRDQIITIDGNVYDVWNILRKTIPVDKVWTTIANGQAKTEKEKVIKDALQIESLVLPMIKTAKTEADFIRAGAYAETLMKQKGYSLNSNSCGALNLTLLSGSYQYFHLRLSPTGAQVVHAEFGRKKFVKRCGNCGVRIGKDIAKGYRCSCGGVYQGC